MCRILTVTFQSTWSMLTLFVFHKRNKDKSLPTFFLPPHHVVPRTKGNFSWSIWHDAFWRCFQDSDALIRAPVLCVFIVRESCLAPPLVWVIRQLPQTYLPLSIRDWSYEYLSSFLFFYFFWGGGVHLLVSCITCIFRIVLSMLCSTSFSLTELVLLTVPLIHLNILLNRVSQQSCTYPLSF